MSMKILKGNVKYKDRNDITCTYGTVDDGTAYYFMDSTDTKKFSNGGRIATTLLVEAIDPMVKTSNIGVIGAEGNVIIPFENKSIRPVNDNVLIVENSTPVSESVIEAINLKNDPLSATKLVSTTATIKEKLNQQMGADGKYLFNDQFSEATLSDIYGNNLVNNERYSFIAQANDKLYMSKNVADSVINEFSLMPSEIQNNVVTASASQAIDISASTIDQNVVENAIDNASTTISNSGELGLAGAIDALASNGAAVSGTDNSADGISVPPVVSEDAIDAVAGNVNAVGTESSATDGLTSDVTAPVEAVASTDVMATDAVTANTVASPVEAATTAVAGTASAVEGTAPNVEVPVDAAATAVEGTALAVEGMTPSVGVSVDAAATAVEGTASAVEGMTPNVEIPAEAVATAVEGVAPEEMATDVSDETTNDISSSIDDVADQTDEVTDEKSDFVEETVDSESSDAEPVEEAAPDSLTDIFGDGSSQDISAEGTEDVPDTNSEIEESNRVDTDSFAPETDTNEGVNDNTTEENSEELTSELAETKTTNFDDNVSANEDIYSEQSLSDTNLDNVFAKDNYDVFSSTNVQTDKLVDGDDYYSDYSGFDMSMGSYGQPDTIMTDVAKSMSELISQNRAQKNLLGQCKGKIDNYEAQLRVASERYNEQVKQNEVLSGKLRELSSNSGRLEARAQLLDQKVHELTRVLTAQEKELNELRPQLKGKQDLVQLLADARALLGTNDSYGYSEDTYYRGGRAA